jgi:hypothetical protein
MATVAQSSAKLSTTHPSESDSKALLCYLAILRFIARWYMAISFLPMVMVAVLAAMHLVMALCICVVIVLLCLCFSWLCYNAGIFAVSGLISIPISNSKNTALTRCMYCRDIAPPGGLYPLWADSQHHCMAHQSFTTAAVIKLALKPLKGLQQGRSHPYLAIAPLTLAATWLTVQMSISSVPHFSTMESNRVLQNLLQSLTPPCLGS